MSKLKKVLASYVSVEMATLGGRKTRSIDSEHLRKDLTQIIRGNNGIFITCVVMILFLFGIPVWIALTQPQLIKAGVGVFGVTAGGLIVQMISLWREKVATELVLGLIRDMDPSHLETVISALVKKMK
jgi:hypothetical protein